MPNAQDVLDSMEQIDNLSVGDLVYVPEYGMGIVWRHHDHLEDIFDVGDKVRSCEFGLGIVTKVYPKENTIPIEVMWVENPVYFGYYDYFTSNGQYYEDGPDAKKDITLADEE